MNEHYKFVNVSLPYAYDALEPYIDTKTMELHHDKHLQTYIDNLNKALENYPQFQNWSLEQLLYYADRLPTEIRTTVKNNAGGVYNHLIYFEGLNPKGEREIDRVRKQIIEQFGSYENFEKEIKKAALSVFGSGYAWLVEDNNGRLSIITTANQDTPIPMGLFPIINVDVWEHAYYLKNYNRRNEYLDNWLKVIKRSRGA